MRHAEKTKALGCDQGLLGIGHRPMFGLSAGSEQAQAGIRRLSRKPWVIAPREPGA